MGRTTIHLGAFLLMAGSGHLVLGSPDFEKEIAPILENHCLSCHDSAGAEGDLVLETAASAKEHGKAIVPGKADASLVMKMIGGPDPKMPKKGAPLSSEQISILKEWINAGAQWPEEAKLTAKSSRDLDWWSLHPISPSESLSQDQNPVDALLEKKLREKKLSPTKRADSSTLIRRVTYDLTGLPPSIEEVDSFLAESKKGFPSAWTGLVNRLLASPAFGEKFAQHWLDLARYAETHGYDKDKPRPNAWPYRDYVIRSFNEDKPYARFVKEQIAGDVLFPDDPDGVLGLGFLAAGPWDFIGHWEVGEGKLDGRIAKHLDRDEIVSAVFNVFQSSTVQCAQCHHHKFDPIRMEDYYRLHAVFSAVDRADRVYDGLPPDRQKKKHDLLSKISSLKQEQGKLTTEITRLIAGKASGLDRRIAELKEKYGTGLKPQYGYHSQITKNQNEVKWVQLDLGKPIGVTEIRIIPAYDNYNGIGGGFGFPVRYRVEVSNDILFQKEVRILRDATNEDQPNPKTQTIVLNGDGNAFRYLRVTATKLRERNKDFIFALGEVETVNEGGATNFARGAVVTAKDTIEAPVRWGKSNLVDGIFFRELGNDAALAELRELEAKRQEIEKEVRTPQTDKRLAEIKTELAKHQAEEKAIPDGQMVYAAATHFPRGGRFTATEGTPRPIRLLHRGDLESPGDSMTPGVPPIWKGAPAVFFGEDPEGVSEEDSWSESEARAELAHYLTDTNNPLVWRSIANRLWQWTFGNPLVGTPNDFGQGGMAPTHPELLDFLAAKLRDDPNQSIKSVLRLLMTSDAYLRSSEHDQTNADQDADNAYLWRFTRRRLTAEELRDSILLVSGKMNRELGGPSFQDFVIEKPQHSPHYEYHLHDPNDPKSHRRTIYRFVVRSQPQPMLTTLDCADPSMSVPERDESTTALQALTQWNHRFVDAMSLHFAGQLESDLSDSPDELINTAFRKVAGRKPTSQEFEILADHLKREGTPSFARVLFNLNAFVYVD